MVPPLPNVLHYIGHYTHHTAYHWPDSTCTRQQRQLFVVFAVTVSLWFCWCATNHRFETDRQPPELSLASLSSLVLCVKCITCVLVERTTISLSTWPVPLAAVCAKRHACSQCLILLPGCCNTQPSADFETSVLPQFWKSIPPHHHLSVSVNNKQNRSGLAMLC